MIITPVIQDPAWNLVSPYNQGMGIIPLIVGLAAAGASMYAANEQSKAASEGIAMTGEGIKAQIKMEQIRAQTQRHQLIQNIYTDTGNRGRTVYITGLIVLGLVGIVGIKKS